MIYYECIKPMTLYRRHEVSEIETISETPVFAESPWIKIRTKTGRTFYTEKRILEDMQRYSNLYPTEIKGRIAPAQTKGDKKGSGVSLIPDTANQSQPYIFKTSSL